MLRGLWLLVDFDGTLVSTPHKSHGRYLSLDESPCLHPIKRWLLNGGSVCIATTADGRVFEQAYIPLRSILKDSRGRGSCGELLLSLCTGAALYRCTMDGVEFIQDYAGATHLITRDAVLLAKECGLQLKRVRVKRFATYSRHIVTTTVECVEGTSFSSDVYNVLLGHVKDIFLTYLWEALSGVSDVVAAISELSARYKKMWQLLFSYLDVRYRCSGERLVENAAVLWKHNFLRSRLHLFEELGMIRPVHARVRATAVVGQSDVNKTREKNLWRLKERILRTLGDDSEASQTFSRAMIRLLAATADDTSVTCDSENDKQCRGGQIALQDDTVAQVIALGIPIKLFSRYFGQHIAKFTRLGVRALPQPNSVVFAKFGVSKSTVIRYLTDEQVWEERRNSDDGDNDGSSDVSSDNSRRCFYYYKQQKNYLLRLQGIVDITKSVAVGDNPHTSDYELTMFPQLPFVSVEMTEQRQKRVPALGDRYLSNLYYVSGEELGASVFFSRLMDELHVPPVARAMDECAFCVGSEVFSLAVITAATKAFAELNSTSAHL